MQKPILSLGCLAQQGYWSDLRADTGTLFFPDKIWTKHNQTQLHKEESLFLVIGMMVAPLLTAGVSDEVAQEIQMPVGPHTLEDVDELMSARQRSWHSRSYCDGTLIRHIFRASPGARCASNPEDMIHHIANSRKSTQLCLNFNSTTGYMGDGGPLQIACFFVRADTSSGAIHATMVPDSTKMDMPYVVAATA